MAKQKLNKLSLYRFNYHRDLYYLASTKRPEKYVHTLEGKCMEEEEIELVHIMHYMKLKAFKTIYNDSLIEGRWYRFTEEQITHIQAIL